jgi:N-acylneuraminate cytidylyltransferase
MKKNTYAIIFARGGSKGLHRKNLKKIGNLSLLEHSIFHAQSTPLIRKVFVSTEDKEIADVALAFGAVVIERPIDLATDKSPEWLSWKHAVNHIETNFGIFDGLISLPATSPLRNKSDVEKCINEFYKSTAAACISISESARNPFFNMVKVGNDGFVDVVMNNKNDITRRQDAPKVFDITTVCYMASPKFIKESDSILMGDTTFIEVPRHRALDIDDDLDFEIATLLYNKQENQIVKK